MLKKYFSVNDTRYSKAIKTSYVSIIVQAVNVFTSFISVPLIINSVGVERFGLWAALSAALSFLSFSDFGLGIGMQNKISYFTSKNMKNDLNKVFVSSFYMSIIFAVIIYLLSYAVLKKFDLSLFIQYKDYSIKSELPSVLTSVIVVIALGIIAGIVQRTFDAFQEGYIHKYIAAASRILSLGLLYICTIKFASMPMLILIFNGIPHICLIIIGCILIKIKYKISFSLKYFSWITLKAIFKIGILGLGAGVSIFLVTQAVPILFTITYGLSEVALYSVIMRVLNLVVLFYTLTLLPIWPGITDAFVKNDITWIKKTIKKTRKYVFLSLFIILVCLLLFIKPVITWWTGHSIIPSYTMICACILFVGLLVWNTQVSVFLNGASLFKGQSTYGILIALVSIGTAFHFRKNISQEITIIIISIGLLIRDIFMEYELKNKILNIVGTNNKDHAERI